jgi:superoxide dismutase, Fe-Mn family
MTSRRKFITLTGKAGLAVCLGSSVLSSCVATNQTSSTAMRTGFEQKPLPYAYDALAEAIDTRTMEIHYSAHAAGYASNLRDAARAEGVNQGGSVEELLDKISKYSPKMRNNAGGHYNHEMFWNCMRPLGSQLPEGQLKTELISGFGSVEAFKTKFEDAAKSRFGSGWAWLIVGKDKKLLISSTPNQDNPLMDIAEVKGFPLLALDVWEHAYYLRYQNKRAEYIANWWKVVNWEYVHQRYQSIL